MAPPYRGLDKRGGEHVAIEHASKGVVKAESAEAGKADSAEELVVVPMHAAHVVERRRPAKACASSDAHRSDARRAHEQI